MHELSIPRRRIALAGGAMLVLATVGLSVVSAGSGARPTSDQAAAAVADALLTNPGTATGKGSDAALLRPRRLGRTLVHGTVTLDLPQKGLVTVQLDHGKVSTVGANSITISEVGNTSLTIATGDKTRVRKNDALAKLSDLKAGDEVFVVSELEGGTATAYRIVVPKAA
jgi:hypothetical protein